MCSALWCEHGVAGLELSQAGLALFTWLPSVLQPPLFASSFPSTLAREPQLPSEPIDGTRTLALRTEASSDLGLHFGAAVGLAIHAHGCQLVSQSRVARAGGWLGSTRAIGKLSTRRCSSMSFISASGSRRTLVVTRNWSRAVFMHCAAIQ